MNKETRNAGREARTRLTDTRRDDSAARPAETVPEVSIGRWIARDWRRIALIALAAAAMAWILAALQPPRYRASALASVAPLADRLQPNELLRGVEVLERRTIVATVAALAATPTTRTRVAAAGDDEIEAAVLPNTNLFRVNVEGSDPARVTAIANRVPEALNAETRAMYRYYGVSMISAAARPDAPFAPRTGRAILAGLLIGLFLGLLTAYARVWRAGARGTPA